MKSKASSRLYSKPVTCSAEQVKAASVALSEVYQQQVLQHNRHPVGHRSALPEGPDWHQSRAYNPLCGDEVALAARLTPCARASDAYTTVLQEMAFSGDSCAICTASASLLCQQLPGLTVQRCDAMAQQFTAFVHAQQPLSDERLQPLSVFAQMHSLPNRKNCATLPWQALQQLLAAQDEREEA